MTSQDDNAPVTPPASAPRRPIDHARSVSIETTSQAKNILSVIQRYQRQADGTYTREYNGAVLGSGPYDFREFMAVFTNAGLEPHEIRCHTAAKKFRSCTTLAEIAGVHTQMQGAGGKTITVMLTEDQRNTIISHYNRIASGRSSTAPSL